MQYRSVTVNTAEVLVPVVAAVILGLGILALLAPPAIGGAGNSDPQIIRIYSSVPMHSYASIVHGAQMAFEDAGNKAGNFRLDFVPLADDRLRPDGSWHWEADLELANARRAAEDLDAMAYIGTYNSGAAKVSIPVLNRVHMAMISPGNTYPGLTKPGTGTAGEPWTYYPLGVRNYFRVVPADDLQGSAAAAFAKQSGFKSVYVLDDTELYGHGIATIFAQSARDLGLNVLGAESIDVRASDYTDLANQIKQSGADLVYFGGTTDNHPGLVLRDLQSVGYSGAFMGADGIADNNLISQIHDQGGLGQLQVYSTLVGLPAVKLTGAGADWYKQYKDRWSDDNNEDFAPFGYEAARVAISAINRAGKKDREAIRAAVASTTSGDLAGQPILGKWRFDANGDTSLVTISVQQVNLMQWSYQGLMSYDPQFKTWTFQREQQQ